MAEELHASARIFRVRVEFTEVSRELRIHVLCECGSGGWIAAIAPFPELFFDACPLIGRTVGEALVSLDQRYLGLRVLLQHGGVRSKRSDAPAPSTGARTATGGRGRRRKGCLAATGRQAPSQIGMLLP